VSKELTLNLGLRYDIFTVPTEVQNRIFNRYLDPNNPQLAPGFGPIINQYYNPDHTQLQPRVGLAYNRFGRGQTVLRAGFAKMSMGPTFYETVTEDYELGSTLPFAVSMNQGQTQASGLRYPYNANGYVADLTKLEGAGVISSNLPVTAAINLHFPDPYSLQWMFGVQQALPWLIPQRQRTSKIPADRTENERRLCLPPLGDRRSRSHFHGSFTLSAGPRKLQHNPAFRRVAGRQAIETVVVRSAGFGVTTEQKGVAERPTIPFPSGTAL
jgi:hypothetical protein